MSNQTNNSQEDASSAGESVSGKKWEYVEKSADEAAEAVDLAEEKGASAADVESDEGANPYASLTKEALIEHVQQLKTENTANFERVLRAQAEVKNIQQSARKDVESARKFALKGFVQELLEVVDNLDRSFDAVSDVSTLSDDVKAMFEGVQLTHKSLLSCLEKFGVEQVNPMGESFDPDFHEAISMQPNAEMPANTVIQVLQKGYRLNGRLVRPAMVIVSTS